MYREYNLETLGLSVINSARRGYPPEEGSHIAIRISFIQYVELMFHCHLVCLYVGTVRRFLEKHGDSVDVIVFVVTAQDLVYNRCLSLWV